MDMRADPGHDRREIVPRGEGLDEVGAATPLGPLQGRGEFGRAGDPLGLGAQRPRQGG